MDLTVGAGILDRVLRDAEELLVAYRTDDGLRYLDYRPSTDPDRLMPEDLAVTILINSRVTGRSEANRRSSDESRETPTHAGSGAGLGAALRQAGRDPRPRCTA